MGSLILVKKFPDRLHRGQEQNRDSLRLWTVESQSLLALCHHGLDRSTRILGIELAAFFGAPISEVGKISSVCQDGIKPRRGTQVPAAGGEVSRREQRGEGREVRAEVDEHVSQRKGQSNTRGAIETAANIVLTAAREVERPRSGSATAE